MFRDAGYTNESLKKIDDVITRYEEQLKNEELAKHLKLHPQYAAMYATKGMLQMDNFLEDSNQGYLGTQALNTLQLALNFNGYQNAPAILQKVEILCHLARVHCAMKNYKTATDTFQEANKLVDESIGEYHPLAATVLASWSRVYYDRGDTKEAIKMLEDAWRIRNGFLRSELHPNPLVYAYFLTNYYKEIGNNEKALRWCATAINGYAYLISKEEVRVRDLKEPHIILENGQLPSCDLWKQRLDTCRTIFAELN